MKKLMLLSMIVLSSIGFARDYEYNEKRDIVIPMEESIDRMSRFSSMDLKIEQVKAEENIAKYADFHRELDRSDMGENSER